ncbi:13701_t:CDS:1 [Funneliformis mosseae]|uniref:13701_t:CDS:1 n=1 Tax=Funneliformis mosseae TaxID=27381 RepID=A0A9N9HLB0_FUNMO|nr:13701_t:CDS:1 [Funneliformis mosseae]
MQTTTFDPNYTIFNKRFIPEFISDENSLPIDLEPLEGDQFWPNQRKPPNMLNKRISKKFKSLKSKVFHKNRKGKNITMDKNTNIISTDEGTTEIDDIYSSFQDIEESNSSNTTEDEARFSTKNDFFTRCNISCYGLRILERRISRFLMKISFLFKLIIGGNSIKHCNRM